MLLPVHLLQRNGEKFTYFSFKIFCVFREQKSVQILEWHFNKDEDKECHSKCGHQNTEICRNDIHVTYVQRFPRVSSV